MEKRFPFRAEYAKNDGEKCNTCNRMFKVESLRIGRCVPSPYHDGVIYHWYHRDCIFSIPQKPKDISSIANFDNIRWNDQEHLKIETGGWLQSLKDISRVENESILERPQSDDLANYKIEFTESGIILTQLPPDDENHPTVVKRARLDTGKAPGMTDFVFLMKEQNEKFFSMREKIKQLDNDEMTKLLNFNNQRYSLNREDLMDALADRLAFGSVSACKKCHGRRKFISGFGYVCMGTTKWNMCDDVSTDPKKRVFEIPQSYRDKYEFLRSYVPNVEKRVMRITASPNFSFDSEFLDHSNSFEQNIDLNLLTHKLKNSESSYLPGIIIDPKTHLQDIAQVYQCNNEKYSASLAVTNILAGLNSFYKLWIMQYFHEEKYSLLRSWGRIGTTMGGSTFKVMPLDMCTQEFKNVFFEKSGNHWESRENFIKRPYKMNLIDTQDDVDLKTVIECKLQPPIYSLMSLIFNLNLIKNLMADFRIDVDKMPSSKLSKCQIHKAFNVLQKLQDLLMDNTDSKTLAEASNEFYTLIPHSFGVSAPPILDNITKIKEKCEMLDSLMELEIAQDLMNLGTDERQQHPLDAIYKKLHTKIDILDSDSEEYKLIEKYTKNTHAATHSDYTLQIENVFKIEREGETDRYQRFENLHNKKLLWHGSRTTNFGGLLSQGLRIAPPEAPSNGYMFGKGIYFADMVSKSANYCCADEKNPTGLLLLCEVALGNMYKKHRQCPNLQLPKNKHSTFGKGKTYPNPKETYKFSNGVKIPYGPPISNLNSTKGQLLYNEYIVYDPAQVKIRYLVRIKFDYQKLD